MLAQIQLDPQHLGYMVAGLIGLLGASASAVAIWAQLRRRPPIEAEFATKAECEKSHGEIRASVENLATEMRSSVTRDEFSTFQANISGQLGEMRGHITSSFDRLGTRIDDLGKDIMATGERRAVELHNRINAIESEVARVDERTRSHRQTSLPS